MLTGAKTVRGIAREIEGAANAAFRRAYVEGAANEEEPAITARILEAIEGRIRNLPIGGVVWRSRILRAGSGVGAEEKRLGADLMGVLDVDLPGYKVKKGFLAQAKKAEPGRKFSKRDWERLRLQCETMLQRTPDSFVFVYSRSKGIRIFSATSILGLESGETRNIFSLYDSSVSRFFESYIECFIGDPRLHSAEIKTLDMLADFPVANVLELSAKPLVERKQLQLRL